MVRRILACVGLLAVAACASVAGPASAQQQRALSERGFPIAVGSGLQAQPGIGADTFPQSRDVSLAKSSRLKRKESGEARKRQETFLKPAFKRAFIHRAGEFSEL